MPKPNKFDLTWEDVQKEIAAWPAASAKAKASDNLTEEQKRILCGLMRSGKKLEQISDLWGNTMGLPGSSHNTLRRMFNDLKKQGY